MLLQYCCSIGTGSSTGKPKKAESSSLVSSKASKYSQMPALFEQGECHLPLRALLAGADRGAVRDPRPAWEQIDALAATRVGPHHSIRFR